VATNAYVGTGTPRPWGPEITFDSAYTYAGGGLLFTISHTGLDHSVAVVDAYDFGTGVKASTIQISGFSVSSNLTSIPVAKLDVTPEPASLGVLTAVGVLAIPRRRRSR
jgi:hypothetical protein